MRDEIKPTYDIPFKNAIEDLTGFEIIAIEKKFGRDLEGLGGIRSLMGTVWAIENRTTKVAWDVIEAMSVRELHGYFPTDPDDDSEAGKE